MLARLTKGLSQENESHFIISLLTINPALFELKKNNVKFFEIKINTILGLFRLLLAIFFAIRYSPSAIMGWMYHGCFFSMLFSVFCLKRNIWNIRHSLDNLDIESGSTKAGILLCRFFSFFPAAILYNSNKALLQHEKFGYCRRKSIYMPNGFFFEDFSVRNKYNETSFRLLCVGRNHPSKGFEGLIKNLSKLDFRIDKKNFNLTIVGKNVSTLKREFPDLVKRKKLELFEEVASVTDLYSEFDVLVLPSLTEGFPNVLCEAVFSGLAAVVCDVGDAACIVRDPLLVYDRESCTSLKQALSYAFDVLGNRDYMEEMRTSCKERYAMSYISEQYRKVLY